MLDSLLSEPGEKKTKQTNTKLSLQQIVGEDNADE